MIVPAQERKMLDHLALQQLSPEHFDATVAFYVAFLEPLGYHKVGEMFDGKLVAFGATRPELLLSVAGLNGSASVAASGIHLAFSAKDRATADKCYAKGIKAGGIDSGKPGLRPEYGEGYYAAFVFDPSGNNIEVVHRESHA